MQKYVIILRHYVLTVWVWAFIMLPGFSAPAYGTECLDESPTIRAREDPYGAIKTRDLTPVEYGWIKSLFKSLEGEWQGTASDFFCTDFKDPTKKTTGQYTLKARVQVDYFGNFLLDMDLYSQRRHVSRPELMRFYLDEKRLRINTDSNAGDVQLITVQERKIQLLYRLLLPGNDGRGSIHKEFFVLLSAGDNTFSIRQRIYSQGRLSSQQVWDFSR